MVLVFFVTSSDSGSLVIDGITAGGKHDVFEFEFTNTVAPIGDCGELAFKSINGISIIFNIVLLYVFLDRTF